MSITYCVHKLICQKKQLQYEIILYVNVTVAPVTELTKTCHTFSLAPSKEQNRMLTPVRERRSDQCTKLTQKIIMVSGGLRGQTAHHKRLL